MNENGSRLLDNKVKVFIIKLIEIEDKILDLYRIIIKKEIYKENTDYEIEKIKELKKQESFIYNLTYEELNQILENIEQSEELYCLLIQRISNLINIIIDKKHLKERIEEAEEYIDEENIDYKNKENTVVEYVERDLILLKIKKLTEIIDNCNKKEIRNILINYKFLHLYSNILVEEEMLNNKFNPANLHLLNILTTQLSQLPQEDIEGIYEEIYEYEMKVESIQNILNINNIILSEGINEENKNFIETEILINAALLEAKMDLFSISKETIIEILKNKIVKDNEYIINSLNNKINNNIKERTSYLTLIRKK